MYKKKHEDFNENTWVNDVALFILSKSVTLNNRIQIGIIKLIFHFSKYESRNFRKSFFVKCVKFKTRSYSNYFVPGTLITGPFRDLIVPGKGRVPDRYRLVCHERQNYCIFKCHFLGKVF